MLKAGFSRIDVTPPLGSFLAGYYEVRRAKGILDPIEINTLALTDGENTVVILACDFEAIHTNYADIVRKKVANKCSLPIENVFLHSIHQHTSIGLFDFSSQEIRNDLVDDTSYMDYLYRKFEDTSIMAIADMSDAEWSYAEKETDEQVSFIRRYIMTNGKVRTNPHGAEDQIVRPAEKSDNTVRLIKLEREGKKDIAFVNFQTHPDIIGGEYFSADWPGFARRFFEKDNDDTYCFLMNGFQGDVNHVNFMGEKKRFYPRSVEIGHIIADTVSSLMKNTKPIEGDAKISANASVVYSETSRDKEEYYDECLELCKKVEAGENWLSLKTPSGIGYQQALRIVNIKKKAPIYQKIPVAVINIGKLVIAGLGGEPFTNYATAIRNAHPDKIVYTACITNGYQGYFPTKVAFEQGGYEVVTSVFKEGVEEECTSAINKFIKG